MLLGAAIRGLLKAANEALAAERRAALPSGERYASAAKPQVDWDDQTARQALVDARARDAHAVLALLQGRPLTQAVAEAVRLLAAVVARTWSRATMGVPDRPQGRRRPGGLGRRR